MPVVSKCQTQGLDVVSSDVAALPARSKTVVRVLHVEDTEVEEVQDEEHCDEERNAERLLGGCIAVRWVAAVVENQHENN